MITEGTSDRGPQYINIHDPISHMVDNTNASSVSKAKVGSRIKSNFKALGTRYCDSIKGDKEDRSIETWEKFAAAFIGIFMSLFLFIEGSVELIKAVCDFESSNGMPQKPESNDNWYSRNIDKKSKLIVWYKMDLKKSGQEIEKYDMFTG